MFYTAYMHTNTTVYYLITYTCMRRSYLHSSSSNLYPVLHSMFLCLQTQTQPSASHSWSSRPAHLTRAARRLDGQEHTHEEGSNTWADVQSY